MRIRSLYLNIYLTVITVLLLFALVAGVLVRRHMEAERERIEAAMAERTAGWAGLIEKSLPGAGADEAEQRRALLDAASRLRVHLTLRAADGHVIASTDDRPPGLGRDRHAPAGMRVRFADGRVLTMAPRPPWEREAQGAGGGDPGPHIGAEGPFLLQGRVIDAHPQTWGEDGRPPPERRGMRWFILPVGGWMSRWLDEGLILLGVLFIAIAAGSYPVVRRLTRRLETLQRGVETFGAGALDYRVPVQGSDEVSAVAHSFNQAAQRIEDLVRANRTLLANASHELRSPLARLKMAVSMLAPGEDDSRAGLRQEIDRDIRELDALVEEVLLASRLDAQQGLAQDPVDLPAVVAEEAARWQVDVDVSPEAVSASLLGDERLLRRAVRNLLENARRYGGEEVHALVSADAAAVHVRVCDRGAGVPEAERERIFQPFYRLPGHSEKAGGVGLGLSLVRQIAQRHGGSVRCEPREGGGSCFVLSVQRTG